MVALKNGGICKVACWLYVGIIVLAIVFGLLSGVSPTQLMSNPNNEMRSPHHLMAAKKKTSS